MAENILKLEFKKEDFTTNNYSAPLECAITKALERSGFPNLMDTGLSINCKNKISKVLPVIEVSYSKLRYVVLASYANPHLVNNFIYELHLQPQVDLQTYK